jgi:hypothetical protein
LKGFNSSFNLKTKSRSFFPFERKDFGKKKSVFGKLLLISVFQKRKFKGDFPVDNFI